MWWVGTVSAAPPPPVEGVYFDVVAPDLVLEGDPIPLRLVFSAEPPETWQLDAAKGDRSGRLSLDQFTLEPPAPDPLGDWFHTGPNSLGGLRVMPMLDATPFEVVVDLAEHARLAPGRYTLRVDTDRVRSHGETLPLTAVGMTLVVAARPAAEEAREVAALAETITSGGEEAVRDAAKALRFRTSEVALRAMVGLLGASPHADHHLVFGVVGSPHRDLAVALVEGVISDPRRGVGPLVLDLLATLVTPVEAPLPEYEPHLVVPGSADAAAYAAWRDEIARRSDRRRVARDAAVAELRAALPNKVGAARTTCLHTLVVEAERASERQVRHP